MKKRLVTILFVSGACTAVALTQARARSDDGDPSTASPSKWSRGEGGSGGSSGTR